MTGAEDFDDDSWAIDMAEITRQMESGEIDVEEIDRRIDEWEAKRPSDPLEYLFDLPPALINGSTRGWRGLFCMRPERVQMYRDKGHDADQLRSTALVVSSLLDRAAIGDERAALQVMAMLRKFVDQLEATAVIEARHRGWSWRQISSTLGIPVQTVHDRHSGDP